MLLDDTYTCKIDNYFVLTVYKNIHFLKKNATKGECRGGKQRQIRQQKKGCTAFEKNIFTKRIQIPSFYTYVNPITI